MKKINIIIALLVSSFGFSQSNTIYKNNSLQGSDLQFSNSVFIGDVENSYNNTGDSNVYIGKGAKAYSGSYNVAIGKNSGFDNYGSSNNENVTIGYRAGEYSEGTSSIAIGSYANEMGGGVSNICIGQGAGSYAFGNENIFIGKYAGGDISANNKLIIDVANNYWNSSYKPLIYGDTQTKQLCVSTMTIPEVFYKLAVGGGIVAEELLIDLEADWPDYVFKEDYKLASLKSVEQHIAEKGHLENIPSAAEVLEKGILVGDMNAKLLRKIEELTLYTISQQKQIEELKNMVNTLVTKQK